MSAEPASFVFTSRSGGPAHKFELQSGDHSSKSAQYVRKDGLTITWDDEFGWSGKDAKSGDLLALAWGVPAAKQGDSPPEGTWVTKKGDASYVHDMKYAASAADKKAQAQRYREAVGGVEM